MKRIVALMIVFGMGGCVVQCVRTISNLPVDQSSSVPQKTIVLTDDEKAKRCYSGWDGAHINLKRLVKPSMKDPESFEHITSSYIPKFKGRKKGTFGVEMTFRGNNSFGGKTLTTIFATSSIETCSILSVEVYK
jgi:hypothetical protein